jgi:hypothetical protein
MFDSNLVQNVFFYQTGGSNKDNNVGQLLLIMKTGYY